MISVFAQFEPSVKRDHGDTLVRCHDKALLLWQKATLVPLHVQISRPQPNFFSLLGIEEAAKGVKPFTMRELPKGIKKAKSSRNEKRIKVTLKQNGFDRAGSISNFIWFKEELIRHRHKAKRLREKRNLELGNLRVFFSNSTVHLKTVLELLFKYGNWQLRLRESW